MAEKVAVQNSIISVYTYDAVSKVLEIEFSRRPGQSPSPTYRYRDVPQEVITEFAKAEHKGGFFQAKIRNMYAFTKIEAEHENKTEGQGTKS